MHEQVRHGQFGCGSVIKQTEETITVRFSAGHGVRNFEYPLAFEKYLTFEKASLQESIREEVRSALERSEEERRRREEEKKRREEEERLLKLEEKKKPSRKRAPKKRSIVEQADE